MHTILCVDDEHIGLLVRKFVLEHSGYNVVTAEHVAQALDIFKKTTVDAVVIDYVMPEMDGLRVAKTMREIKPAVPIIMLTALNELPEKTDFLLDGFVVKGQSPSELLRAIQQVLH
jgi:CheY-like chemotaxis protein